MLLPSDCSQLNHNPLSYESSTNPDLMNMCWTDSVGFLFGPERGWGGGKNVSWREIEEESGGEKNFPIKSLSEKGTLSDMNMCT